MQFSIDNIPHNIILPLHRDVARGMSPGTRSRMAWFIQNQMFSLQRSNSVVDLLRGVRIIAFALVSQKHKSKYHTVNNLSIFLDVQNANLFVMYVKARFRIKFEQTKSYMVPIFYLIIS
jgi:hypothetical protein